MDKFKGGAEGEGREELGSVEAIDDWEKDFVDMAVYR